MSGEGDHLTASAHMIAQQPSRESARSSFNPVRKRALPRNRHWSGRRRHARTYRAKLASPSCAQPAKRKMSITYSRVTSGPGRASTSNCGFVRERGMERNEQIDAYLLQQG